MCYVGGETYSYQNPLSLTLYSSLDAQIQLVGLVDQSIKFGGRFASLSFVHKSSSMKIIDGGDILVQLLDEAFDVVNLNKIEQTWSKKGKLHIISRDEAGTDLSKVSGHRVNVT
jgi:hypothetical protein